MKILINTTVILFYISLLSCSSVKQEEQVASETPVYVDENADNTIEQPKESDSEKFIESHDLENHQKLIDKEKQSKFQFSIDEFLIKKLQLKETFNLEAEIYSISIHNNKSQNFHSLIVGLENTCCFYKTYLVNYSLEGEFIDTLLITQGDYIESFTHLESDISENKINRSLFRANVDTEPSEDEVWKEDEFTIDSKGAFQGKDLIFRTNKESTVNEIFIGKWKKEDSSNPIDPTTMDIMKGDKYQIKFSNSDYFVPAKESANRLIGKSNSGNFEIELISENPLIISYSDDGRGHFEPVRNERFVKVEFNNNIVVDHYICYKNDKDTSQYIWISFAKKYGAIQVKYKGQKGAIDLKFDKEIDHPCDGCAHPTIEKIYNEIYEGKINGVYKLTHSGVWDYVEYTRGKDGKIFNFTIDHNTNPYGKTPCF